MITREQVTFTAQGDQFMPSKVKAYFTEFHDPGVIGNIGRYRGVPIPYGCASIDAPENTSEKIKYIHSKVVPILEQLRHTGASSLRLHITYHYDTQCALGFSDSEMKLISELGCELAIDCLNDATLAEQSASAKDSERRSSP
jgi:hypothetical protein